MQDASQKEDVARLRAAVLEGLVKELRTGVIMCDVGYYIPKVATFVRDDEAEDILANPQLMERLKSRVREDHVG